MIRFACSKSPFRRLVGRGLLAVLLVTSTPVLAAPPPQSADEDEPPAAVSHAVVEPTGPSASRALNDALVRLGRDPRNLDALLAAGYAAIALGDNDAALGFFTRANQIEPTNGPAKAAIADARLHLDDPVEALHWYALAEQSGADPMGFALDRGLAYDLVGDNAAAVLQYRLVLDRSADPALRDEATRREALSLAIGGDRRSADLLLLPLLQRADRAAWRAHIFVLAVAGRGEDAVVVARATMPPDLAGAIAPYLRFMPRLTPAQQAAVASQGRFPRAADIGRDDPRVMAYSAAHPRIPLVPAAAPALAQAQPAQTAKAARNRRRHGQPPAPVAVAVAAPPSEPDIVLPPPPPPPSLAVESAPQTSPVVPHPAVLSRLDVPPPARTSRSSRRRVHAAAAPAPAPAATHQFTALAVVEPTPASAAPAPGTPAQPPTAAAPALAPPPTQSAVEPATTPGVVAIALPASNAPPPIVEPAAPKPEPAKPTRPVKTADDAEMAKSAKDKAADRAGHAKSAHGKQAKEEVAVDLALPPCTPAELAKLRKAKTAASRHERRRVAKARPRHGLKGKKGAQDVSVSDTCDATVSADGPGGPTEVSRDSDSDDSHATKGKAKGKGKSADRDTGKAGEKTTAKGARHARYESRIWVEVLTGADRDKMPGEWHNLLRKAHPLKGHKPYITPWHSNFRLLTGPFDSDADAQDFIAELRKDGVSGFEWTSPAGQAVDSLTLP